MKEINHNELRASSRVPVDLDIVLYCNDRQPKEGRMLDISFGGAFIEVETKELGVNDLVTIDLYFKSDNPNDAHSLAGTVIRTNEDGAGLVFDEYDNDTVDALRRVYRQAFN